MSKGKVKTFCAVLEARHLGPRFVFAPVPFDPKKLWPEWRTRRVVGEMNGIGFRTSLFPVSDGKGFVLLVNRKMQTEAKVTLGSEVQIKLEPDLAEHVVEVPAELTKALKADRQLRKWFDGLSPSMRRGIGYFIDQAKTAGTRERRAEAMAESLMLAMEGEQEAPPILRVAFQRRPAARAGWEALTPTQRRNHLLGIFFVQTVEGRERRAAKAVEECLRVARRKGGMEQREVRQQRRDGNLR